MYTLEQYILDLSTQLGKTRETYALDMLTLFFTCINNNGRRNLLYCMKAHNDI